MAGAMQAHGGWELWQQTCRKKGNPGDGEDPQGTDPPQPSVGRILGERMPKSRLGLLRISSFTGAGCRVP